MWRELRCWLETSPTMLLKRDGDGSCQASTNLRDITFASCSLLRAMHAYGLHMRPCAGLLAKSCCYWTFVCCSIDWADDGSVFLLRGCTAGDPEQLEVWSCEAGGASIRWPLSQSRMLHSYTQPCLCTLACSAPKLQCLPPSSGCCGSLCGHIICAPMPQRTGTMVMPTWSAACTTPAQSSPPQRAFEATSAVGCV